MTSKNGKVSSNVRVEQRESWITTHLSRTAMLFRGGYTLYHVNLSIDGWKPKIQLLDHDQVARDKETEFNKLASHLIPEKFVQKVLGDRQSFDFVIFITKHDKNFIQFWTGKGMIDFNFPMFKSNGLLKYEKGIKKLLEQHAFEYLHTEEPKTLKYLQYTVVNHNRGRELYANFGKNTTIASHFAAAAFKDVYKESVKHLKVKLG